MSWAVYPEDQARQDREHRDYMNLLTLIEGASIERLGSVAWRVKRYITPESNFVYSQNLVHALQKRALHVIAETARLYIREEPMYSGHIILIVTDAVLAVTQHWETIVNNVSVEG